MNKEIQKKAVEALGKLREHPAVNPEVNGDSLFDGLWFHMVECCKHGRAKSHLQEERIYRGEEGWDKYKDRFEEEYKDDYCTEEHQYIEIPYEDKYGEPWSFDHVEYWYEVTFFVFQGDPYNDKDYWDQKKWARYAGPEGGANTFDEMLIDCWDNVKKEFGDFSEDSFLIEAEIENHKEQTMFIHGEDECITIPLERNEEYLDVEKGLINLRWLKWYIQTEEAKKDWDEYCDGIFQACIDNIEKCMPESRREILKKYKK